MTMVLKHSSILGSFLWESGRDASGREERIVVVLLSSSSEGEVMVGLIFFSHSMCPGARYPILVQLGIRV